MGQLHKKTDTQIQDDVLRELRWDPRVEPTNVGVEVDDGIVTLTGTVDSWSARVAAQEAAHRVIGVLDVVNDIHVVLPSSSERTDADVARSVRAALESDVDVPHDHIMSTVTDGVVTLEGTVDYWSELDDAARAVRNLPGVREVRNRLGVEPQAAKLSPEGLRQAIENALERRASHAGRDVQIAIGGTTVILTGTVPSWPEHDAVVGAVRAIRGVHTIDDQITVAHGLHATRT